MEYISHGDTANPFTPLRAHAGNRVIKFATFRHRSPPPHPPPLYSVPGCSNTRGADPGNPYKDPDLVFSSLKWIQILNSSKNLVIYQRKLILFKSSFSVLLILLSESELLKNFIDRSKYTFNNLSTFVAVNF